MQQHFELFDILSGNVLDTFDRESDAIDALVEISREGGAGAVARFALFREINGESQLIAMQDTLTRRVAEVCGSLIALSRQTVSE